jgi:iron complex transport system substrate-binding protein
VAASLSPLISAGAMRSRLRDIAGRTLHMTLPAKRIVLGDGPLAYVMALLEPDDPFANVVGWADNFRAADLEGYRAYQRRFAYIDAIPTFKGSSVGALDAELAISLRPDVIVLNLSSRSGAESSGFARHMEQAGIAIMYVDFRSHILENTEPSLRLMGQLLGQQQRAADFIDFRREHLQHIANHLTPAPERPSVMIERAAGLYDDCCLSYGDGNFGELITAAAGDNLGQHWLHGPFGTLHPEQVIAAQPDVILVTGANWTLYSPAGSWVNLGPGADLEHGREQLRHLMQRPAYRTLNAVHAGRVHAIWHPFYDNPCHFIAVLQIAKWLHPQHFTDLDPDAVFAELHRRFLPVPYQQGYWLSLEEHS